VSDPPGIDKLRAKIINSGKPSQIVSQYEYLTHENMTSSGRYVFPAPRLASTHSFWRWHQDNKSGVKHAHRATLRNTLRASAKLSWDQVGKYLNAPQRVRDFRMPMPKHNRPWPRDRSVPRGTFIPDFDFFFTRGTLFRKHSCRYIRSPMSHVEHLHPSPAAPSFHSARRFRLKH